MGRLLCLLSLLLLFSLPAQATGLIEEDTTIQATFNGEVLGLEALVVRPDDGRKHPLVVLSHGAPRKPADREGMRARNNIANAREFARRGWVVVAVMRRGYGESQGEYAESSGPCDNPDYVKSGRIAAEDIRQTILQMAKRPYVDGSKVVAVGQSAGGFSTVALTADPPPGLVAAISFAGGRGSNKPDSVCTESRLVDAFRTFGRTSRIPMMWVYTRNDHFFGPSLSLRFHTAFTEAGGQAQFVGAPDFGTDGHFLFSASGAPLWTPYVETFLASRGLTQFERPLPPRDTSAITYPKGLTENGRDAFVKYLDGATHKAFVMSSSGAFGWRTGRKDADQAVEEATEFCAAHSKKPCYAVMIDNDMVQ
ncbi:Dienelactone hydrolase [Paramagnetospirillum magnetotacticum MS-1]|uniref:Dienelactone hydrolase n=1 Tax=Paramagnetospirillum magnetotacticum MS-1 TaxID=272627 RepID=A0A0C2YPW2_PARME|nr:CocE/NonD family hydrolase [Paramagnetospirillum magnetotacticum]KIL97138.1 Dienelactone hydrolase [Paramagnetospirillum magnetotacticum MS-1]